VRLPLVVRVEEGDEVPVGGGDTQVARGRTLDVGVRTQKPDAVSVGFEDGGGVVRRAVVHDDDLAWGAGLPQHGLDRPRHEVAAVVGRDDHGHAVGGSPHVTPHA
jgi:hypothetical protein